MLTENEDSKIGKGVEESIWYLDNGASNHMTGCREKFKKLDKKIKGEVKFRDGSRVKIKW